MLQETHLATLPAAGLYLPNKNDNTSTPAFERMNFMCCFRLFEFKSPRVKGDLLSFFFFSPPSLSVSCVFLYSLKILKVEKVRVHTNKKLCDITLCHMSHNWLIYAWKLVWYGRTDLLQLHLLLLPVLAQTCASWPTRGDWVFGRWGLKETGVKTFQTEVEYTAAALESVSKLMGLSSIKACKSIH